MALGHNGNLTNTAELRDLVADLQSRASAPTRGEMARGNTTDTVLITTLLTGSPDRTLEATALEVLPQLRGAFSLVFMDEHTLYAARDPHGIRPLVLGRLERGWVVASETAALDIVGASLVREIEPGELVTIDENGLRTQRFAEATPHRVRLRVRLPGAPGHHDRRPRRARGAGRDGPPARRASTRWRPISSSPRPESGTPAAIGYAEASGIPYGQGLVKNAYVGRTFIQPSQTIRQLGIRLKLNPLRDVVRGKRLVVVDDSIVRGNTQRALVRMLREAGAAEVHVRISSPPVKWPCFYGIDFASRAELIANGLTVEEICSSLGADSLGYIGGRGDGRGHRAAGRAAVHRVLHRQVPGAGRRRVGPRHPAGPDRAADRRRGRQPRSGRRRGGRAHPALTGRPGDWWSRSVPRPRRASSFEPCSGSTAERIHHVSTTTTTTPQPAPRNRRSRRRRAADRHDRGRSGQRGPLGRGLREAATTNTYTKLLECMRVAGVREHAAKELPGDR